MPLDTYGFGKYILPHHKRTFNMYSKTSEIEYKSMTMMDYVIFTLYSSTVWHNNEMNIIKSNIKVNDGKKVNWIPTHLDIYV